MRVLHAAVLPALLEAAQAAALLVEDHSEVAHAAVEVRSVVDHAVVDHSVAAEVLAAAGEEGKN